MESREDGREDNQANLAYSQQFTDHDQLLDERKIPSKLISKLFSSRKLASRILHLALLAPPLNQNPKLEARNLRAGKIITTDLRLPTNIRVALPLKMSNMIQALLCGFQVLACAINATSMALIDAGVPLKGLVAAVAIAVQESGGLILDPLLTEQK
eukprot:gene9053-10727_t